MKGLGVPNMTTEKSEVTADWKATNDPQICFLYKKKIHTDVRSGFVNIKQLLLYQVIILDCLGDLFFTVTTYNPSDRLVELEWFDCKGH